MGLVRQDGAENTLYWFRNNFISYSQIYGEIHIRFFDVRLKLCVDAGISMLVRRSVDFFNTKRDKVIIA